MKFLVSCIAVSTVPRVVFGSNGSKDAEVLHPSVTKESTEAKAIMAARRKICDAACRDKPCSSDDPTNGTVPDLERCSSHHGNLAERLRVICKDIVDRDDKSDGAAIYLRLYKMLGEEAPVMAEIKTKWKKAVSDIKTLRDSKLLQSEDSRFMETAVGKKLMKKRETCMKALEAREEVDQENKDGLNISAKELHDVVTQMRTCKTLYVTAKRKEKDFKDFQTKCKADRVLQAFEKRDEASQVRFTELLREYLVDGQVNVGTRVCALAALHAECAGKQEAWKAEIEKLAGEFSSDEAFEGVKCECGDLKKMDRCQAKFFYKYDTNGEGLSDINRASIILPSVDGIIDAVKKVDTFFAVAGETSGGVLRMKNRFLQKFKPGKQVKILQSAQTGKLVEHIPDRDVWTVLLDESDDGEPMEVPEVNMEVIDYDAGYSDILMNVRFEGIICEVQIHLQSLVNIKKGIDENGVKNEKMKGHKAYKVARRFSENFDKVCFEGYDASPSGFEPDARVQILHPHDQAGSTGNLLIKESGRPAWTVQLDGEEDPIVGVLERNMKVLDAIDTALEALGVAALSRHSSFAKMKEDPADADAARAIEEALTALLKSEKVDDEVESRRRLMDRLARAEAGGY